MAKGKDRFVDYEGGADHNKQIDVLGAMQTVRGELSFRKRDADAEKLTKMYQNLSANMSMVKIGDKVANAIDGLMRMAKAIEKATKPGSPNTFWRSGYDRLFR